jgi:adenosylcobinamide-phosphate synthase
MATLLVFTALVLDGLFGEPRRFHPLVGFGRLAQALEGRLHADSRARGGLAVLLLLTPFSLLALLIDALPWSGVFGVAVLYLAIGWKSLDEHARCVRDALLSNDLPAARQQIGFMVSRDTAALDHENIARATLESVLENGNDAVFGAIFWFVVAGAPGVVMAAGAGSLGVVLGGSASYHGAMQARPPLGEGHDARLEDIDRALRLIRHTLLLWILILLTGGWLVDHILSA